MFLGEAVTLVTNVGQILFPKLSLATSIDFPVNVLCLQDKYTIARNNDMVYLCSITTVAYQKIVVHFVLLTGQICQK